MYKKFGLLFCLFICGSCIPIVDNGEEPADLSILDLPDGAVGSGELNVLAIATCKPLELQSAVMPLPVPISMEINQAKIELKTSAMLPTDFCSSIDNLSKKVQGGTVFGLSCSVAKDSLKQFAKTRPYLITIQQNVLLPAAITTSEFAGISGTISVKLTPAEKAPIVVNIAPVQTVYVGGSFPDPSKIMPQTSNISLLTPPVDLSTADLQVVFTASVACSGNKPSLPSESVKWDIGLLKLTPQ